MFNRIMVSTIFVVVFAMALSGLADPSSKKEEKTYKIHGFLGESSTTAAPNKTVTLFDADSNKALANTNSNFFGKYAFKKLSPGHYLIKVGEKVIDVYLIDKDIRLDIDLSAKDGTMNYASGAATPAEKPTEKKSAETPPGQPDGDAELAKQFSGKYYSYTGGSTLSGGGGSESQIAFCPDGSYFESYESGYYGSGQWGQAGQSRASGKWSIQGTIDSGTITITYASGKQQAVQYQTTGERGCYKFDGRLYCYNGACD
ncbi:MAG: carboxypeptidase-like regulatory domain-containing protein [Candidatus Zixiibacteriota bacterium]